MSENAVLRLAVVRFPQGWRILAPNGRWGRFADRGDAERAALRLALMAREQGRDVKLCVQDACGRLRDVDAA